ncbi:uncharacterized protein LOC116257676 [Nymphaea colorata]|nr:uncharacterized protein LOC116257676 [Nymphaea colorata]
MQGGAFPFVLVLCPLLLLLPFGGSSHQEADKPSTPTSRFQRYLRIRTCHPSPDYEAAASFLVSQAKAIGLKTLVLEFVEKKPVLVFSWPGQDPSLPSILLNCHMDSVPAEAEKWLYPPFSATKDPSGNIFARGSQDDKCIGMQYLEALRNLKKSSFIPLRTIHVSFVPDEEIGGLDGAKRFVGSREFMELNVGFILDEGQASPTGEFRVFYADRLPWSLVIRSSGKPGHGSKLYDGSAMENLVRSMEIIARFRENQFDMAKAGFVPKSEVISVNPVYVKAGTPTPTGFVMNLQPSEAEAGFDVRLPPMADPELLRKRIAYEWAPSTKNMTYQLIQKGPQRDYNGHPLVTFPNESNPWWKVFEEAVTASGGKLSKPEILASTTDARYAREMGIPTLGFSPMMNTPILLHEHNEFLNEAVYLNGVKVYESIIRMLSLCSLCSQQI